MATQMTSARRGVATDEMKQVAKDEEVTLDWLIPKIASGSIIIPSFPWPVLYVLLNFYQSSLKIPVIVLRFHVQSFKWLLIIFGMSNVRGYISGRTLTTDTISICVGNVGTL